MTRLSVHQRQILRALADGTAHARDPRWNGGSLNALQKAGLAEVGEIVTTETWFGAFGPIGDSRQRRLFYRITVAGRRELNDARGAAA